jgi:translation initiation factor IF-2
MHPTTPLRAEPSTPLPTEQQRRHQAKPGLRQGARKREDEEGNLRLRSFKRSAVVEPPPIDREITVAEGVTVKELSEKLGVKANLLIKKLVERKIFATINQTMDVKLAEELARDFGASTNQVSYEEESTQDIELAEETKELVRRAPVVTIMGHVDHGKTSLLDAIRQTNVAGREAGGITQHIGAYRIEKNGRKIVFIDTPGHQAFTRMRARGAKVTDIVVLVVSADDGVMPQTLEAISHAKAAGVPLLVAINKIDKPDATPDRVKQQLSDRGLLAEDWGGDVVMVPVSAKTGQNLDLLLEMILLVADLQDLKANPGRPALGTVLEAQLDRGRGPVATMLVRNGTLRVGDSFICGALFSKVRAMFDDRGNAVKEAEPSMPVEVIGLDSLPEVGDSFQVVSDTSKAKQIVIYREAKAREVAMAKGARVATLDSLHKQFKEGDLKDLNLIIKADVGGTAEVLSDTLQQLSTDKVRVRVLHAGVGTITETDVLLASASDAIIVGFNTKPDRNAQAVAEQQKITIRLHSIIYELIDETKLAMSGLLDPVYKETIQGHAEVKEIFKISKVGTVAGCYVSDGAIRRDSQVRVLRGRDLVHTGKIQALKRFKNDASEVKNGLECGISLTNFNNVNVGDVFEAFTMERVAAELPTLG